ncbi:MAG: hypothetical protein R6V00_05065 [Candidatus Aminicenantes bacterium]
MKNKKLLAAIFLLIFSVVFLNVCKEAPPSKLQFALSFSSSAHSENITGRVFVFVSEDDQREPRLQAGSWRNSAPFFGKDVEDLEPGQEVLIDENILGYPTESLQEIPEGEYYVQALVNIYTRFERSDGHVIWAHMDQWEGQQFNRSPGNLCSEVKKVHLDPDKDYQVELNMDQVIPPIKVPEDTSLDVCHHFPASLSLF